MGAPSSHQLTIRPTTAEDLPALLELIRELAQFERLEHEVEATVKSLSEAFFGPQAVASALLANVDGQTVGYAIYYFTFSSFLGRRGLWLDDVYVRPAFRQRGVGRALIKAVAQIAAERQCGRLEWTALNWNQNALDFYRTLGMQVMDEWVLLRLKADGLRQLAES
jgi:GNAT superfamily N-acetyltransferase